MSKTVVVPISAHKHLEIAENFERQFVEKLNPMNSDHWTIVVMFYSAVHYLRYYLIVHKQIEISSHADVRAFFRRDSSLGRTDVAYNTLQQYSQNARYYGYKYSPLQVQQAHQKLFDAIKAATYRRR